jgi:hypothetical protein
VVDPRAVAWKDAEFVVMDAVGRPVVSGQ